MARRAPNSFQITVLVLCLTHLSRQALAEESTRHARFEYRIAPNIAGCANEGEVRESVTARLGRDPFDKAADVLISATILRQNDALVARIEAQQPNSGIVRDRTIRSESGNCETLLEAMSLAIAIAIDPLALSMLGDETQKKASHAGPTPTIDYYAGASSGVLLGATPGPSLSLGVQMTRRRGARSTGVGYQHGFSGSKDVGASTISASLRVGTVMHCFHVGRTAACGLLGIGRLRATGTNLVIPTERRALYLSAGGRGLYEKRLAGKWSAIFHADVVLPILRNTLTVNGIDVWTPPPLSVAVGVGARRTFW